MKVRELFEAKEKRAFRKITSIRGLLKHFQNKSLKGRVGRIEKGELEKAEFVNIEKDEKYIVGEYWLGGKSGSAEASIKWAATDKGLVWAQASNGSISSYDTFGARKGKETPIPGYMNNPYNKQSLQATFKPNKTFKELLDLINNDVPVGFKETMPKWGYSGT